MNIFLIVKTNTKNDNSIIFNKQNRKDVTRKHRVNRKLSMSIAVVTGASSGIGYAVTRKLASLGYTVYACARRLEPIEPLVQQFGSDLIKPYHLDISDNSQIVKFREFLTNELPEGKLDLLYNNAGQACSFPALDVTDEIMQKCFKVNVFGHINMTRELSKLLINAKGTIVFTGSVTGVISLPFITIYSATKSAIHQYARGLHLEMKPFGVRVINAITGGVETAISETRPFPEDSLYNFKQGKDAFNFRNKKVQKMSADSYAEELVNDILSKRDPVDVYRGSYAWSIHIISLLVPMWVLKLILYRMSKLDIVERVLNEKKMKKTA